jgi:hypothetical protein
MFSFGRPMGASRVGSSYASAWLALHVVRPIAVWAPIALLALLARAASWGPSVQRAGTVTTGAACGDPVSASENRIIRNVNRAFDRTSVESIQNAQPW